MANKEIFGINMDVDPEYIAEQAQKAVLAAVAETLSEETRNSIVIGIVNKALNAKYDSDGKLLDPSSYRYDKGETLMNMMVGKAIREETTSVIEEIINKKRPEIRERIKKELTKKATTDKIMDAFLTSFEDAIKDKKTWGTPMIKVDFSINRRNEE